MSSTYFHGKVCFLRQADNGLIKQTKEEYLIDAMSYTEAEARILQEVGEGMREVTINSLARSPIKEVVFYGDTDLWFKTKVTYSVTDEDSEKEKAVTTYLLINANDSKEAYERATEHLKEMLVPFEIPKVEKTKIVDIYEYQKAAPAGFKKVESVTVTARNTETGEEKSVTFGKSPDPTDGNPVEFSPEGDTYENDPKAREAEDRLNQFEEGEEWEDCAMEDEHIEDEVERKIKRGTAPTLSGDPLFPTLNYVDPPKGYKGKYPPKVDPTQDQVVAVHDSPPNLVQAGLLGSSTAPLFYCFQSTSITV